MKKPIIVESRFGSRFRRKTSTGRYNPITKFMKDYFHADHIDLGRGKKGKVDQIHELLKAGYTPLFLFGDHAGTYYSLAALKRYKPELKLAVESFDEHFDISGLPAEKKATNYKWVNCRNWVSKSLPLMENFVCVGHYLPSIDYYRRLLKTLGITNEDIIKLMKSHKQPNILTIVDFVKKLPNIDPKRVNGYAYDLNCFRSYGHPIIEDGNHLEISRKKFRKMGPKEVADLIYKNTLGLQHYFTFDIDSLDGYYSKPGDGLKPEEVTSLLSNLKEREIKPITLDFNQLEEFSSDNKRILEQVKSIIHTLYD